MEQKISAGTSKGKNLQPVVRDMRVSITFYGRNVMVSIEIHSDKIVQRLASEDVLCSWRTEIIVDRQGTELEDMLNNKKKMNSIAFKYMVKIYCLHCGKAEVLEPYVFL